MKNIVQILKAEIIKQHRNIFHSKIVYFSLLIWPIINFINAYYSYKPFDLSASIWKEFASEQTILFFLITGFMGYICFWSLVQSAWLMGFERQHGTLETIFLSPANRMAIIYGRTLGALFENVWMFFIFSVFLVVWTRGFPLGNILYMPISFFVLMISATVWGGLMNVIFLFSRDAGILVTIFDEPMVLFSGVRIPPIVFPIWAKIIATFFPLTHVLIIIRGLLIQGSVSKVLIDIYGLCITILIIVLLTVFLLKKAERNAREKGNLTFY